MRREDREIKQLEGIVDVLSRCDTMRLGIADADAPYIVPLSFGYELLNGRIAVYFHGAQEGRKAELLRSLPRVCVEADLCHGFPYNGKGGYTCDYESVIGWGDIELLSGEDAEKACGSFWNTAAFGKKRARGVKWRIPTYTASYSTKRRANTGILTDRTDRQSITGGRIDSSC
jgi:nitroimidazol reductase NimA-like FMN-containing flavoprotein (pyridoxamine 5'-phosphate oxidase superfamily)